MKGIRKIDCLPDLQFWVWGQKREINKSWKEMRHEEQLKLGTTTTLDEPVSETIVSEIEDMKQDNLSVFSALARSNSFDRSFLHSQQIRDWKFAEESSSVLSSIKYFRWFSPHNSDFSPFDNIFEYHSFAAILVSHLPSNVSHESPLPTILVIRNCYFSLYSFAASWFTSGCRQIESCAPTTRPSKPGQRSSET